MPESPRPGGRLSPPSARVTRSPFPKGFVARSVRDHRVGPLRGRAACFTHRTQIPGADVAGQALIRQPKAQLLEFVVERAGPQVQVLGQPRDHVVDERIERIRVGAGTHAGRAVTGQILADRFTVEAGVTGDRRDRPTTFA
jgi:hypothetical protein